MVFLICGFVVFILYVAQILFVLMIDPHILSHLLASYTLQLLSLKGPLGYASCFIIIRLVVWCIDHHVLQFVNDDDEMLFELHL